MERTKIIVHSDVKPETKKSLTRLATSEGKHLALIWQSY
nr:MAG TPA: hypothetical protein [Caudoviricetes sp.]